MNQPINAIWFASFFPSSYMVILKSTE